MANLSQFNNAPLPRELAYFMKQFSGHTTFVGATKAGIFSNYPGTVAEKHKQLYDLNSLGHSIYFTVNETAPSGRKMEDLESIRAIFADDDEPRDKPYKFPLAPSIIVQTSAHTADVDGVIVERFKHQYYWLTKTEDYQTWELVMEGIIKVHRMDPGAKDLARILRVPGFLNHKYDPPSRCSMVQCEGTVYSWEDILSSFPPIPKEARSETATIQNGDTFNEHAHFQSFLSGENIAPSMNALISHWGHHYSADKIRKKVDQLFEEIPVEVQTENKTRYYDARVQIDKFIKSIKSKVAVQRKSDSNYDSALKSTIASFNKLPGNLIWDWSNLKSNEFPDWCLPGYLLEAAKEVGRINGIGKEPAIVSAMAITSALLNKNIALHEGQQHLRHYCAQGSIIVMETGASKSAIYDLMNKPFFDYEREVQESWAKKKNTNLQFVKALEKEMKARERSYDKQKSHTDAELEQYVMAQAATQDKIDAIQVTEPSLYINDITEESILRKLIENNSTMALISDDARKPIDILLGEYKRGKTGESIYINGFSSTAIISEREGRETRRCDDPSLNVLFMVQPDTAIKLRDSDMYVPSGLAARMPMFFYPTDGANVVRDRKREQPNPDKVGPYYRHLRGICLNRHSNPLNVRLSEEGRTRCKEFDLEFADMLEGKWQGEFAKLNKFVSTSLQYAVCMAALDDPEFQYAFKDTEAIGQDYILPIKYMNMGFEYARVLFQQSIITQSTVNEEGIPRKSKSFVNSLKNMYNKGKIYEGFVNQGDFRNSFSNTYRDELPSILEFLLDKDWVFTTVHSGDKRKLNNGFPNKLVDEGDIVYHLNIKGINKREAMGLDKIEDRSNG